MKQATALKEGGEIVASMILEPVPCRRFQINRIHHRVYGPAPVGSVPNGSVEAAGKSHSDHTLDKSIHFRQADGRKLGKHLEHQVLGRYSF